MAEQVTTGMWTVDPDKEAAFIEAWASFATWASTVPGATTLRLGRVADDRQRFISFAAWKTADAVTAWKAAPEFRDRLAQVMQHVDEFSSHEIEVVVAASDGLQTS